MKNIQNKKETTAEHQMEIVLIRKYSVFQHIHKGLPSVGVFTSPPSKSSFRDLGVEILFALGPKTCSGQVGLVVLAAAPAAG